MLAETRRNLYDGISEAELALAPIMAARTLIETEPNYSQVSARLLLDLLRHEALSFVYGRPTRATHAEMVQGYAEYFQAYVRKASRSTCWIRSWRATTSKKLATALKPERDLQFQFLGLQTLYDRYFLQIEGSASSCRRCSSCASPWGWPRGRSTARRGRSSSTT